jgi:glucose uptake protein GlcU
MLKVVIGIVAAVVVVVGVYMGVTKEAPVAETPVAVEAPAVSNAPVGVTEK